MAQLPAGMRNNNPGNIKFLPNLPYAGVVGPSINTDQGDPQAVFASPEAGMAAMAGLLRKKYLGGKTTPNAIIAAQGGWTPGNFEAAANVARSVGIGPDDDIAFTNPVNAQRFMRALMLQEHGQASNTYTDAQIAASLNGMPTVPTSALAGLMSGTPTAAAQTFQPAFGDVVAANDVPLTPFGDDINSMGLGFLQNAEKRRRKEEAEAEAEQDRRVALFSQSGLGGLYG